MKRAPELRDLSDDHHTGLVLARRCKLVARADSGVSPEDVWQQVLEAFELHLEPHFQIEEQHLVPGLEAIGEGLLAARIREDHAALRDLGRREPVSTALVEQFGELLAAHIRLEERQVFEPAQSRLPPEALKAIASACRDVPRICPASLGT